MIPSFIRVARRSLDAGDAVLERLMSEKAGFLAYHAFESVGGAYCTHHGVQYHPATHPAKLLRFAQACDQRQERFARNVAELRLLLSALRNLLLYPRRRPDGTVQRPEEVMSLADARRLLGRVRALVTQVERVI